MNPQQVLNGMEAKNRELSAKVGEYADLSEKRAAAERAYKMAYTAKLIDLKSAKESVTTMKSLAEGDNYISQLKYELDVADGILKACGHSIKALHSAIESYRSLLSWMKMEYQDGRQ